MRTLSSVNYPAPPWTYTQARILNVACRAQYPNELYRWLPDALVPLQQDGTFVLWCAQVPNICELGADYSSTECGIVVPVRTRSGDHHGSTFVLMIVDNDIALTGGREIWGYPKILGDLDFREAGEGNVHVQARHKSYRSRSAPLVMEVQATMDGKGENISALVNALEPRYLERVVPSPYGPESQSREVLRVAHRDAHVSLEKTCGSAEVQFGATVEGFERLGSIEARGAMFRVCSFVLPYAQQMK